MTTQPEHPRIRWFGRSDDDPNRLLIIEDEQSKVFLDAPLREELYAVIRERVSHSSAPTEQEIREKVLEKIERAHDCLITEIIHARAEDREYLRIKKAADILLGLKLELRTPTPEEL